MAAIDMTKDGFRVTPWEISGKIDYERLIKEFGVERITPELLRKIEHITGETHFMLRRGIFFAHRDLSWLLNEYFVYVYYFSPIFCYHIEYIV